MSKKKFSAGLDDLFKNDDSGGHHAELYSVTSPPQPPTERRPAGKNFMAGLDALLQEALEESLDKLENNQPSEATPPTKSKSRNSGSGMYGGLDALIRQTIDVQALETDEQTGIKRLTVAVEKAKLEKFKTIARLENSYMKDLLVGLIDEYIAEYTKDKGINL